MGYGLIVVGASLGGLHAVRSVLTALPLSFPLPIAVVQHRDPQAGDTLRYVLQESCALQVCEVEDKQAIEAGRVYLAPGGYHLLVDGPHFALSTEDPVLYAQPAIDVLFETAAEAFGTRVIGVVLTGASADGAAGLAAIRRHGGLTVIESPATAVASEMPEAAKRSNPDAIALKLEAIGPYLLELSLRK
ncbi:MAG: chemotaxis protein CheB [Gammaproteobacteria bacterium]|nr:chemotaxis protein CheB [Gammaproteobacteria bacterium]